jgi:hypothetical protein
MKNSWLSRKGGFLQKHEYLETKKEADILSFVIMPKHVHAVIHLSDDHLPKPA